MKNRIPTQRQYEVLRAIQRLSPYELRTIAESVGLASRSSALQHVRALRAKGLVSQVSPPYVVTQAGEAWVRRMST